MSAQEVGFHTLVVRIIESAVEVLGHSAHVVHANETLIARSKRELAATAMDMVHIGSSLIAVIGILGGLFALETYPVPGVLLTLGGMALLLHSVAVLCGAHSPTKL